MKVIKIPAVIGVILAFSLPEPLMAQERWVASRIDREILFDGVPDEPLWEQIEAFQMISHVPVPGKTPSERSVIRLAYDDKYLYVGASLYVSKPAFIHATGKKRDLESMTTDYLGISIDSYNDKENALLFFTNPNGIRWDATVSNDGTPAGETMPINMNWNTFWDVKTTMDEMGWYTEMRIPISSLRFQPTDQAIVMGISFFRWVPAKNEGYTFPEISLEWGDLSTFKPSLYAEVEFEGLNPKKPLYISPYLLTGFEQEHELNASETAYDYTPEYQFEPGLDLKFGINPNTTLDLTVNTDFAQVEADDQQFNLTRFSLFFPEKRMFFLERSSIFDFELGGSSNLFYSRRIGLYEDDPVRILGGARINTRVNNWDIGFLDMQTASFSDLPSENFGVLRVKKRVFNEYSYTGGMVTSRLGLDGRYNVAYGLDGVIRLFGDEYLTIRWAQTFQDGEENNPISLDPSKFRAHWERRKREGFSYVFSGSYSGRDFDPGIGFEIFDNYWSTRQELIYTWISPETAKLQTHNILFRNFHLNSVLDHSVLLYQSGPTWTFATKHNWGGAINIAFNYEYLEEDFEILDPVLVPSGQYRYLNSQLMLMTPGTRTLSAIVMMDGGGYFDGVRMSPSIQPRWTIGASVELGGLYQYDFVTFPDRDQALRNHIAGLRALYMLNTRISFSAFVQYNTAIHKVISNVRFRYNPKEGTDLYLVFNEGRNTMLEREIPFLPIYSQRNITLKFTYTFEL